MLLAPYHIGGNAEINSHFIVALVSSLVIPLTFLLGRDLFSSFTGLLAAVGVASSPLLMLLSHRVLVDPVLPFFWSLAVLSYLRSGGRSGFLVTGLLTAVAVLTKFTSIMLLPVFLSLRAVELSREKSPSRWLPNLVSDRDSWSLIGGFSAGVAPYLAWNYLEFGNPVHVFLRAWSLSGGKDPLLTYIASFHSLLLPMFILGLSVALWKLENK